MGKNMRLSACFNFKFVGRLAMSARGAHKKTSHGIWHEFENKTCTTVECFPQFTSLFCSHTRYCDPRTIDAEIFNITITAKERKASWLFQKVPNVVFPCACISAKDPFKPSKSKRFDHIYFQQLSF